MEDKYIQCKKCKVWILPEDKESHKKTCDPKKAQETRDMMNNANKSISKMFKKKGYL